MTTPPAAEPPRSEPDAPRLGVRTVALVAVLYALAVGLSARSRGSWDPRTQLPATFADPLQHLWVMKWYKTCLLEGRSPLICPDVDYPVGSPIGNYSPMHLQSLLYLALSLATSNDILIYNLLWLIGFLFTGLGTFALAWHVTRDRACAAFAGLAAMLSGPMIGRAAGHLELMYVGSFPIFLVAWMRFVDRPSRGRGWAAVGSFLLVALSAAYFLVFAVFPAGLYLLWAAARARRRGERGWLGARARPLLGFAAGSAPWLGLVFAGHVWAAAHGYSPGRSRAAFEASATPVWGYLFPKEGYRLEPAFPFNPFRGPGPAVGPGATNAYLGVATLALVGAAAVGRVRFRAASYWWATLATLVVLGLGARWRIGGLAVPLPSAWLRQVFLPFRLIREVDRFNLFALVVAAVVAAAGLAHLLGRLRRPAARRAFAAAVMALTIADLARPFPGVTPPPMPGCYTAILRHDPGATFLEVNGADLNAATGYWQSIHRGKTTAWFSGLHNVPYLNLFVYNSPFAVNRVEDPNYLADGDSWSFDFFSQARFADYAWLFLRVHDLRYVVVHKGGSDGRWNPPSLPRIDALLASAKVYEDATTAVYARDLIPAPTRPVLLPMRGWTAAWRDGLYRVAGRSARLVAYNPDPDRPLRLLIRARAFDRARSVRLADRDGRTLADWRMGGAGEADYETPPLRLPAGIVPLAIESDGEARLAARIDDLDPGPFSLRVTRLALDPAAELAEATPDRESRR